MNELVKIQNELKAPKSKFNAFGKYKYRNCEDILEAVKPILLKYGATITISDKIVTCGDIQAVEASVTYHCNDTIIQCAAFAGIDMNRKGMDIAQSFGSSSSYARKFALSGLFLIDDNNDPDSLDNGRENGTKTDENNNDRINEWFRTHDEIITKFRELKMDRESAIKLCKSNSWDEDKIIQELDKMVAK